MGKGYFAILEGAITPDTQARVGLHAYRFDSAARKVLRWCPSDTSFPGGFIESHLHYWFWLISKSASLQEYLRRNAVDVLAGLRVHSIFESIQNIVSGCSTHI